MADPTSFVISARAALEAFDYLGARAALEDAEASLKNSSEKKFDYEALGGELLQFFKIIEPVHNEYVRRQAGTGFMISTDEARKCAVRLVDGLEEHITAPNMALLRGQIAYLNRELDDAISALLPHESAFRDDAFFFQLLATCYMLNDSGDLAKLAIERSARLSPHDPETQRLQKRIAAQVKTRPRQALSSGRWMQTMIDAERLPEMCRKFVLSDFTRGEYVLDDTSRIVTIGSCFANNLATALREMGRQAESFILGEEINNSYVNLELFRMMVEGDVEHANEGVPLESTTADLLVTDEFREELRRFRGHFVNANAMVYTLGVSQGFFAPDGRPVLLKNTGGIDRSILAVGTNRFISVDENVANIREMFSLARQINPALRFIVTVSPVPMARSFGMKAAVIADAVSKSILRVCAHEIITRDPSVIYWPSFEIAKWLAPHITMGDPSQAHFGAEDQYSRHVSRRVVTIIIQLFLEYLSADGRARPQEHRSQTT